MEYSKFNKRDFIILTVLQMEVLKDYQKMSNFNFKMDKLLK